MHVLEGTYNLDPNNLDGQQARNEGWLKDAAIVDCQQSIIDFILRHGGQCELIYNCETNFIVGKVFLRELLSNTSDALEELRHIQAANHQGDDGSSTAVDLDIPFDIHVETNEVNETLSI